MVFKKIFIVVLLFLSANLFASSYVRINIFNQISIKTITISPVKGKYQVVFDNVKFAKVKKNNTLYFTIVNDSVSVWDSDKHLGVFKSVRVENSAKESLCKVDCDIPTISERIYDGDFVISSKKQELKITNVTNINSYLAGVVEAESGPKAPYEFYKTQTIISRTYLFMIMNKEGLENYTLGDDVNHQVYKGLSHQNELIPQAVRHTEGLVIIDTNNTLITAVFHSNSGGETLNSEDVWLSSKPYLKGTPDPFSLNQRNTFWQDSIPISKWEQFVKNNGIDLGSAINFNYEQKTRKKYYTVQNSSILLTEIRKYFKLRSTWFSVHSRGGYLYLEGRGYGHGVGMSQEGAMEMARQNYSFLDIIHFYYRDVSVINYDLIYEN